jgi:hypothetical protein
VTDEKTPINWRGVGRIITGGIVGSVAAVASFDHQRSLAYSHGQHAFGGALFPISVDVLILCATFAMDGRNRFWPRATFWAGVGATISANVLAAPPDLLSRLISGWAPFALLLVIEIEARRNKTQRWQWRRAVEVPAVKTEPAPVDQAAEPAKPRTRNARGEQTHEAVKKAAVKTRRRDPQAPLSKIAAAAGVSESTARRELKAINGVQLTPPTPAVEPA